MHLVPLHLRRAVRPAAPARSAAVARAGMCAAGFLAVVNISVMYLTLPDIHAKIGASLSDEQWILSAYALMEGAFTLGFGVLGDLYGRKRVLAAATWLFIIASASCAFAPNAGMLIVGRAAQGIAGAALLSLPLAILVELNPEGSAKSIQLFATVAGLAAGFAPLIGGVLVAWWGWESVFYFSVILAFFVLAALACVSEQVGPAGRRLDAAGQITSLFAFLALTYALIDGDEFGWASARILIAFAVALLFAILFVAVERRAPQPMIDVRYFRLPRFSAAVVITALVSFAWYGLMLLCTLFYQRETNLSEVAIGLYLMPCNAAYFAMNLLSVRLAQALGMRLATLLSFAVSLAGTAWLALVTAHAAPWEPAAALGVAGVGWGIIGTPATAMGMKAVRQSDDGFASGALSLSRSMFGVMGIALMGSLEGATEGEHAMRLPVALCFVLTLAFTVWILALLQRGQLGSSNAAVEYS